METYPEEDAEPPGWRVTGGGEPPEVGPGILTLVLRKSSKCSPAQGAFYPAKGQATSLGEAPIIPDTP